ncbi:MAG: hypothetical protein Athens071416_482 [Parcubacteria group bacterium Athens0714_16]|nr:MAG: hypothetical protein Athens071416_482 [Parcubacteria group bacterium Athens0714_16]
MNILNLKSQWLFKSSFFGFVMSMIVLANPFAIAPQVYSAIFANNVEGISILMYTIFAIIQIAFVVKGIEHKDKTMFISMLISFFESISIIIIVSVRS